MSQEDEARERNERVEHRIDFGDYGFLQFQKGPRHEAGRNGLYMVDDVLPRLLEHLNDLNVVLPSRETACAITKLEECIMWLERRRDKREQQGVLGTFKPHS